MSQDMSREQLSALMDGEGAGHGQSAWTDASEAFVRRVAADDAARRDWLIYAQIGDILRSSDLTPLPDEVDFLQRVSAAIAREPIVLLPQAAARSAAVAVGMAGQAARLASVSRHRPHWSTRMAAGMAAVAGVAVMAWVALPGLQTTAPSGGMPTVASLADSGAKGQMPVADTRVVAPANPAVNQLARAGLVQVDLSTQSPLRGGSGQKTAQIVPVSEQMPMVEYLLAHQQMAGGMMPAVPATLQWVRNRSAEASGLHLAAPAAQSH